MTEHEIRQAVALAIKECGASGVDYEARAMCRDLKQMMESHERYCLQTKRTADDRADKADEWRGRIETKVDDIVTSANRRDIRQLSALIAVLIIVVGFFLANFYIMNAHG